MGNIGILGTVLCRSVVQEKLTIYGTYKSSTREPLPIYPFLWTTGLQSTVILWLHLNYYRVEGKVKHCRIEVEDDQYMLGSASFESLTELVQYYEMNPVFRGKSLRYPVNSEVLKGLGEVSKQAVS